MKKLAVSRNENGKNGGESVWQICYKTKCRVAWVLRYQKFGGYKSMVKTGDESENAKLVGSCHHYYRNMYTDGT